MGSLFSAAGHLFAQLVDLFQFYLSFPIHNHTGDPLSDEDITAAHYAKVRNDFLANMATLLQEQGHHDITKGTESPQLVVFCARFQ